MLAIFGRPRLRRLTRPKMASIQPTSPRMVSRMVEDHRRLYKALTARDARFDGVFFVGVTSTGVYCRPICRRGRRRRPTVASSRRRRRPNRPASAVPALPPGAVAGESRRSTTRSASRTYRAAARGGPVRREGGTRGHRRPVRAQLAADPAHRPEGTGRCANPAAADAPAAACQAALTETAWPVTEVAFASGFSSLRRFNDASSGATACRRRVCAGRRATARLRSTSSETSTLQPSIGHPTTGRACWPFWAPARSSASSR